MISSTGDQVWNLLMIDDDEDDYILTRSMLERAQGHTITLHWARTAEEGQAKLAGIRYDAVLVDYDFGSVNGIDLIRDLTARQYPAPLILYTGRGSFEVDMEAIQAGATLYLPKGDANPLLLERSIRYAIERKQNMDSLRESQERFRSVLENSLDVAYRRNLQTDRYDYISPVSSQVLGFTSDEMQSMPIEALLARIHPSDRQMIEKGLNSALEHGRARLVYRFLTPENKYRWLADYVTIQKDASGQPLYRSGILRDITESKEVEQALRESEQLFRLLVDNIAQLAWMADPSGSILWFNQRWFEYTGVSREEVNHGGWEKVIPPEHFYRVQENFRHALEHGLPWEDTFPMRGHDGQYRWFLSRAQPLRSEDGSVMRWFGTNTDITERQEVEETLRASEERLRLALKGARQGIWDWNLQTDEIIWDERCAEIFGLRTEPRITLEEILRDVIHAEDRQIFLNTARLRDPEQGEIEEEFRVQHADGKVCWVYAKGQVYYNDAGVAYRIAGSMQDITDRKQAESRLKAYADQLRSSNQMLEDFAFVASHDLQEPLRKIQSFGQVLKTRYANHLGEEGEDILTRMDKAAVRMSTMLSSLLAYSRISTTRQPFVETDLGEIVEEVCSDLEVRLQQTGGNVISSNLPVLQADPVQMHQLFQNLIVNSLKFHREGVPPRVEISAAPLPDERVSITVRDNGAGFDMTHAANLFLPFYRLHGSDVEGSGIGLAICRKIVERHHGQISIESQPGQGATVTVVLPVRPF